MVEEPVVKMVLNQSLQWFEGIHLSPATGMRLIRLSMGHLQCLSGVS